VPRFSAFSETEKSIARLRSFEALPKAGLVQDRSNDRREVTTHL
jgi:hypothetical protein